MTAPTLTYYGEGINFTARAAETISGGQLVKAMSSFAGSNWLPDKCIDVMTCDASGDDEMCVGIALNTAGSTGLVDVATQGLFKMNCGDAVVAGQSIKARAAAGSADSVTEAKDGALDTGSNLVIGRALNDAAANEKAFVLLRV